MRSEYLVYPNAIEKLKSSVIEERIKKIEESEDGLPYFSPSVMMEKQIIDSVKYLTDKGFYKHMPVEFSSKFKEIMNKILKDPENSSWLIEKNNEIIKEPCELQDLNLFSGDIASTILKPKELWNHSRFNFSSPSELVITVGAFVLQRQKENLSSHRGGYKWISKRSNGSEIMNEITGDHNADLRIYQTDVTHYNTKDPFGNKVEVRPVIHSSEGMVSTHRSTESRLFVAVMKYIEQQGIETDYQKDKAKKLIKWAQSLGQGGGHCTEHFGGFDQDPSLFFSEYPYPIPILNEFSETKENTPHDLWTGYSPNARYDIYVAKNGDLILSLQNEWIKNEFKKININARFESNDAEHLIKGLIFQSAKGLGRTSAKQLIDILRYRYSDEFEKDQKELLK